MAKNAMRAKHISNRGTSAGGPKTNKNGLSYESLTDLHSEYSVIETRTYCNLIQFHSSDKQFVTTRQSQLFKCMKSETDTTVAKAHGCKNPDECFIDEQSKNIFIIEKKFQQCGGSVCEKIQTSDFKIWQYKRTFKKYTFAYMYCLSDWFKQNCKAELEYLQYKNVPVFWGNDKEYKSKIIHFITNY